jgi:pimeloyl-ACP methyl ester carboxylesterase
MQARASLEKKAGTMGSLRKIYIVHGWAYSLDKWKPLTDLLKRAGVAPVMLPVPGLTAESDEVWNLDKYVEWLNQATSAEKNPFIVVGHSNGGRIGLAFVSRYPEKVERLILIDSAGVYHNEVLLRLKRALFGAAAKIGKRVSSSAFLRKSLYRLARAHDYEQASPQMRQTMVNLVESDKHLDLGLIKTPTTLVWGSEDRVTPLTDGRLMATEISDATLKIVHGGRHSPFYTHPDAVAQYIIEALR